MSRFVPRPSFLTGVDSQSPGADPDALDGGGECTIKDTCEVPQSEDTDLLHEWLH